MKPLVIKGNFAQSPSLNTILMVERTLASLNDSAITVAALKKKLLKQVNHNKLIIILRYLEESNKIAVTMSGITWIHNTAQQKTYSRS